MAAGPGAVGSASRVCPRCGKPYRTIERKVLGGRAYLYAYHGKARGKTQLCYLGPEGRGSFRTLLSELGLGASGSVDLLEVARRALSLELERLRSLPPEERRIKGLRLLHLLRDLEELVKGA
jgi:hypothetical protein